MENSFAKKKNGKKKAPTSVSAKKRAIVYGCRVQNYDYSNPSIGLLSRRYYSISVRWDAPVEGYNVLLDIDATWDNVTAGYVWYYDMVDTDGNLTLLASGTSSNRLIDLTDVKVNAGDELYFTVKSYDQWRAAMDNFDYTITLSNIPEPASMLLLAVGGVFMLRRRRSGADKQISRAASVKQGRHAFHLAAMLCAVFAVACGSVRAAYVVGHTWNLADDFDTPVALPAQSADSEGNTVWSYRYLYGENASTFRTTRTPNLIDYPLLTIATQTTLGGHYSTVYNDATRGHRLENEDYDNPSISIYSRNTGPISVRWDVPVDGHNVQIDIDAQWDNITAGYNWYLDLVDADDNLTVLASGSSANREIDLSNVHVDAGDELYWTIARFDTFRGAVSNFDYTITLSNIPEPASMLLLAVGGVFMLRRKRNAHRA